MRDSAQQEWILSRELTAVYRKRGKWKKHFFGNEELATVRNALAASFEIEDWEFHPRMGFTKEEIKVVLAEVDSILAG